MRIFGNAPMPSGLGETFALRAVIPRTRESLVDTRSVLEMDTPPARSMTEVGRQAGRLIYKRVEQFSRIAQPHLSDHTSPKGV
jgi:hypothetical protein